MCTNKTEQKNTTNFSMYYFDGKMTIQYVSIKIKPDIKDLL